MNFSKASLVAALMLVVGCERPQPSAAETAPAPKPARVADLSPKKAQPKLRTIKLWLGSEELTAEIARTQEEITAGMMHRTEMAENEAMLFVFPYPHRAAFWMKNTLLPLSGAYIDTDGVILEILDMKPKDETPLTAATDQVRYVLETKQGWFERHKIAPGAIIRTEKGPLTATFFRQ